MLGKCQLLISFNLSSTELFYVFSEMSLVLDIILLFMNRIYSIILVLLISMLSYNLHAQRKNQLNFQTGKNHIKNGGFSKFDNLDYWQLSYFRTINKQWQVWVQYTKWISLAEDGETLWLNREFDQNVLYTNVPISRYSILTIDAGVTITLYQKKAHKLVGLVGLAYGNAVTKYVSGGRYLTWDPGSRHPFIFYKYVNEHFIGGTFGAKYDYSLFANRINIGTTVQHQFLNNHMPLTTYLGLHLGVNF